MIDVSGQIPRKPLSWVGSAYDDLCNFPQDARRLAGRELNRVQKGMQPLDWKPLAIVGQGVNEIRVRTKTEHRVIYVARFPEAVYVLHAFQKQSQKTSKQDLEVARRRLATALQRRGRH